MVAIDVVLLALLEGFVTRVDVGVFVLAAIAAPHFPIALVVDSTGRQTG